jgi:hypothetical protein
MISIRNRIIMAILIAMQTTIAVLSAQRHKNQCGRDGSIVLSI